jgi:Ubiquitin elongating factor core
MFVNLSAVMLKLCEPFLDGNETKREKIDPSYVLYNNRFDIRSLSLSLSLCYLCGYSGGWVVYMIQAN